MTRSALFILLFITLFPPSHAEPFHNLKRSHIGLLAANASQKNAAMKTAALPPGVHEQTLRRDDGTELRFTIFVPENYSKETPSPLIVALHYGGDVTPFYGRGVLEHLVAPALKELDAVIIAPDSIAGRWTNETNEAAVIEIIDHVIAGYNIDMAKLLVTGYSMGGQGAWYLAGRNQDRFSAAIPMSGRPFEGISWRIPVYVIHSREDEIIPLAPTKEFVERLTSKGHDVRLVVIEKVSHYETSRFIEPLRSAVPWIRRVWRLTE